VITSSHQVRIKLLEIFLFNGFLSLGTLSTFQFLVLPFIEFLFSYSPPSNYWLSMISSIIQYSLVGLYYAIWALPVFLLSFLMNASWLDTIAEKSFLVLLKQNRPSAISNLSHLSKELSSQLYAMTFCVMFVGQTSLAVLIPVVGPVLNILFLCWLYSLYCFEHKWINWHIGKRLKYIEDNWAYFVGFGFVVGLPFTLASFYCGFWISYAIWFLEFPFFIMTAIGASNPPNSVESKGNTRMALFKTAKWLNTKLLNFVVWLFIGGSLSKA